MKGGVAGLCVTDFDKIEEAGSPFCLGDTFGRVTWDRGRGGRWVLRGLEAHGVGRRGRGSWGGARLMSSGGGGGGGGAWGGWAWAGGGQLGACNSWRRVAPTLEPSWGFMICPGASV